MGGAGAPPTFRRKGSPSFIIGLFDFVHVDLEFVRRVVSVVMAEVAGVGLFFYPSLGNGDRGINDLEGVQGNIPQDRALRRSRHMAADATSEIMDAVDRFLPCLC